jgi:hypothetical protein
MDIIPYGESNAAALCELFEAYGSETRHQLLHICYCCKGTDHHPAADPEEYEVEHCQPHNCHKFECMYRKWDRLSGLVVRVPGYRSGGPGSILGTTIKKVVGLERGPLSLVSTTEELLDRKVASRF